MAEIHETHVALLISGDDLDPDEMTALLGQVPTSSHRKGDVISVTGRLGRSGMWRLAADVSIPGALEAQIDDLLNSVTLDLDRWRAIKARYHIELFCGLFMKQTNEGLSLSPTLLARVAERGIELGFDIYDPGEP